MRLIFLSFSFLLLSAVKGQISNLSISEFAQSIDSSGVVVADTTSILSLQFDLASISNTKKVFIKSGSGIGVSDGVDKILLTEFYNGEYVLKESAGVYVSQYLNGIISILFYVSSPVTSEYTYWEVWEEYLDGSISSKEKFILQF